MLLEDKKPE